MMLFDIMRFLLSTQKLWCFLGEKADFIGNPHSINYTFSRVCSDEWGFSEDSSNPISAYKCTLAEGVPGRQFLGLTSAPRGGLTIRRTQDSRTTPTPRTGFLIPVIRTTSQFATGRATRSIRIGRTIPTFIPFLITGTTEPTGTTTPTHTTGVDDTDDTIGIEESWVPIVSMLMIVMDSWVPPLVRGVLIILINWIVWIGCRGIQYSRLSWIHRSLLIVR